jgi:capsular polysaccharide biosynthesis protein
MKLVWAITASLLVAAAVALVSAIRTPTYEASAMVMVDVGSASLAQETGNGKIRLIPLATPPERLKKMSQAVGEAIDTRPVADETTRRLKLDVSSDELLDNLTVEQVETSQFIRLTYTDTNPARARRVVNAVGEAYSGHRVVEGVADGYITATLYDKASVPEDPVSPNPLRNGLIAFVAVLALALLTTLIVGRGILRR